MKPEELLEIILKEIVSDPKGVKVKRTVDDMGVLLSVELGDGDAGMVIGKQGRTIQAIRTIVSTLGAKNRAKINVKLNVPERGSRSEETSRIGKDAGLEDIGL